MGATNCCSCSGVWRTTASPCTGGSGASAAADACEQARTPTNNKTDLHHFIAVSHGPSRGTRLSSLRRASQRDRRGEMLPRRIDVLSRQRFPRRLNLEQRASAQQRLGIEEVCSDALRVAARQRLFVLPEPVHQFQERILMRRRRFRLVVSLGLAVRHVLPQPPYLIVDPAQLLVLLP